MSFPSEKELKKIRKELARVEASRIVGNEGTAVEKLKFKICQSFVKYHQDSGISQKELAILLGIDEALISKLLRNRIETFSLDRLLKFLSFIHPNYKIEIIIN
jgi:predicted XRE-type DNA-binding protein